MTKNRNNNGIVELWGREFKKVKDGLDKGEVESFVNELRKEQETLLKRVEHLSSLTKLAEKTIVEADKVAEQVRNETKDKAKTEAKSILAKAEAQAKTEAKSILAEAEEQAQKIIKEKRAEAIAMANREAEDIRANAQNRVKTMLEERAKEIRPELMSNAKRIYGELVSKLESLKQQVEVLEKEFEHKLSQPLEDTDKVRAEAGKAGNDFMELVQATEETSGDEADWEAEVLPPLDPTRILDIMNYLDGLPEVAKTELIPQIDKPSIMVFVREPIDLIDILKTLPQVAQVTEDTAENGAAGKPRKVQIELSPKTAPKPSG